MAPNLEINGPLTVGWKPAPRRPLLVRPQPHPERYFKTLPALAAAIHALRRPHDGLEFTPAVVSVEASDSYPAFLVWRTTPDCDGRVFLGCASAPGVSTLAAFQAAIAEANPYVPTDAVAGSGRGTGVGRAAAA